MRACTEASGGRPHLGVVSNVGMPLAKRFMLDYEHDYRAQHRHEHTPDVEPVHARRTRQIEDEPTDDRADDAQDDVDDRSITPLVHDLAGDEPRDKTQKYPGNN